MSGTPTIDLIVPGVGRIHRHVGTAKPGTVADVRAAVRILVAQGRLDLLERLRDRVITPLQLLDAVRRGSVDRLPSADTLARLLPKLAEFCEVYPQSDGYRKDLRLAATQVRAVARSGAVLADLPKLLRKLRERYERAGAAVTFNRHKRVLMSFATWALGQEESPLWDELRRVPSMKYRRPEKPSLTLEEFRRGVAKLPPAHAVIAWSLVLTGMNWKEYTEDGWEQDPAAGIVTIFGMKKEGRRRVVPYLAPLSQATRDYRRFLIQVHRAFGPDVTTHTFRRTYTKWCEGAGVPRFQRKVLLGHRSRHEDVHALYEDEKVTAAVLATIRSKLLAYIGRPIGGTLTVAERTA